MPNIINGNLLRTWQDEGTFNPDGSAEFTVTYKVPWADVFSFIPPALDPHPDFPSLKYYDGRVTHEKGALAVLVNHYRGIFGGDPIAFEQVEMNIESSAQPIELSPIFVGPPGTDPDTAPVTTSDIALVSRALQDNVTPSDIYPGGPGINGETLSGPTAKTYFQKKLKGIDSFYLPLHTWRRTFCQGDLPTYTDLVGYIVIPPSFPYAPPAAPPGQNYLFSGISWRQQGGVVSVTEDYQLSGPGGWDVDLYTAPPGAT